MFPISHMVLDAELAYRRERLMAVRPRRASRRRRQNSRHREQSGTSTPAGRGVRLA